MEILKVYYNGKPVPNQKMEDELLEVLSKYDYRFCGSGFNHVTGNRDLEFERIGKEIHDTGT